MENAKQAKIKKREGEEVHLNLLPDSRCHFVFPQTFKNNPFPLEEMTYKNYGYNYSPVLLRAVAGRI